MPRLRFRSLFPALLIAWTLLPWAAVATAATATTRAVPKEIAVKTLGNGLTIIVWPDHDIPSVALYNWFRVGSRNEQPGLTGLSHFFEHMMFNGAKKYGPGEFDRVMEAGGGSNNAYTNNDVTVYQDWFPSATLEVAMASLKAQSHQAETIAEAPSADHADLHFLDPPRPTDDAPSWPRHGCRPLSPDR